MARSQQGAPQRLDSRQHMWARGQGSSGTDCAARGRGLIFLQTLLQSALHSPAEITVSAYRAGTLYPLKDDEATLQRTRRGSRQALARGAIVRGKARRPALSGLKAYE